MVGTHDQTEHRAVLIVCSSFLHFKDISSLYSWCVCVGDLPACVVCTMCTQCSRMIEESAPSPGTGVTDSCESPCECWEPSPGLLEAANALNHWAMSPAFSPFKMYFSLHCVWPISSFIHHPGPTNGTQVLSVNWQASLATKQSLQSCFAHFEGLFIYFSGVGDLQGQLLIYTGLVSLYKSGEFCPSARTNY